MARFEMGGGKGTDGILGWLCMETERRLQLREEVG